MTAAEFVCMVTIFCIVLPKFVIAMTIIIFFIVIDTIDKVIFLNFQYSEHHSCS